MPREASGLISATSSTILHARQANAHLQTQLRRRGRALCPPADWLAQARRPLRCLCQHCGACCRSVGAALYPTDFAHVHASASETRGASSGGAHTTTSRYSLVRFENGGKICSESESVLVRNTIFQLNLTEDHAGSTLAATTKSLLSRCPHSEGGGYGRGSWR